MSVGCSVRPCPVLEVPDNCSGTGVSCSRGPSTVFTWPFQLPFSQPSYLEDILSHICYRSLVSFSYPADESWSIGDSLGTNTSPAYLKGACLSWAGSSVFYNFLLFLPCLLECHLSLQLHAVHCPGWSTLEAWTSGHSSQGHQCSVKCSFLSACKKKYLTVFILEITLTGTQPHLKFAKIIGPHHCTEPATDLYSHWLV